MKGGPVLQWCINYKALHPAADWTEIRQAYLDYIENSLEEVRKLYEERGQ